MKQILLRKSLATAALLWLAITAWGAESAVAVDYETADSVKVLQLLGEGRQQPKGTNLMVFFARQLLGVPYVAKTLENNKEEKLVVNLRQLDCTTYVETVLALTLCTRQGQTTFADYCRQLQLIRYRNGEVNYPTRLHYFTEWIEDNTRLGFVAERQAPNPPFTAVQTLNINFMTSHAHLYPMLTDKPAWINLIANTERSLTGKRYRYIPKESIANTKLFRQTIHNGDIIAITTTKQGLDTSHIGIAVWHRDGLHLLNASQIRKVTVEEPMTLRTYMQKHPSQQGIRIISVVGN